MGAIHLDLSTNGLTVIGGGSFLCDTRLVVSMMMSMSPVMRTFASRTSRYVQSDVHGVCSMACGEEISIFKFHFLARLRKNRSTIDRRATKSRPEEELWIGCHHRLLVSRSWSSAVEVRKAKQRPEPDAAKGGLRRWQSGNGTNY